MKARAEGKYEVLGPGVNRSAPVEGAAIGLAQTLATRWPSPVILTVGVIGGPPRWIIARQPDRVVTTHRAGSQ